MPYAETECKEMTEQENSTIEKGMTQQTMLSIVSSPLYMTIQFCIY
jgi:hypothetical protein